ncbi:MAG: GNAT family N-acetyltransferase, partial [Methanobrevibacter sp.]|nr:GNAT family N-acetyltransferase [Methanobrevibacter sp.]
IFIEKEYRNQKLGKQLLKHLEKIAIEKNVKKISLEVRQDNKIAKKLYSSIGFGECSPPMDFWVKYLE